jgi:hypothetical protein
MSLIEMALLAPFWGFGLWLAAFPHGVIRFYNWMYKRSTRGNRTAMPTPRVELVEIVGLLDAVDKEPRR